MSLCIIDPLCAALSGGLGGRGRPLSSVQIELLKLLDGSPCGSPELGGGREETGDGSIVAHLAAMTFDTGTNVSQTFNVVLYRDVFVNT